MTIALDRSSSRGAVAAAGPLDSDLEILNYALTLELLEAAAYKAVNDSGTLSGRAATYFRAFGIHEQAHVDAIRATIGQLGGTPISPPAAGYNFSGVPQDPAGIVKLFQQIESLGASAYLGAGPSIRDFDVLEAALSIHAVEAEHAAALADLVAPGTVLFAPEAFATARMPAEVMQIVAPFFAAASATPTPTPPPAPMPGLPNTGGGGGQGPTNDGGSSLQRALLGLGLLGLGAAARRSLRRRSAAIGRTARRDGPT